MSLQNLLNQFLGSANETGTSPPSQGGAGGVIDKISSHIPGGLAGGAAAGGIMALLMSNKSARKVAGKAATYGGAAMLGGLAYKAFQNWHGNRANTPTVPSHNQASPAATSPQNFIADNPQQQTGFEMTLIKAMIAAAKADGHIDAEEQQRIFQAVDRMNLSASEKGILFECLQQDISIQELATAVDSLELKSEIYLACCLVIDPDLAVEREFLQQLASAMGLPEDLKRQLELQARQAWSEAA